MRSRPRRRPRLDAISPGPGNAERRPATALFALIAAASLLAAFPDADAAQLQADPQNYRALLPRLQPGDVLQLAPGDYRAGLPLHKLQGTAAQPITIRGPASGPPAVMWGRHGANTVSLSNTAYLRIRNLVLNGQDLNVDAVKAEGNRSCRFVHHIALENLLIIGHGADQQLVGISTKCPAWGWVIRGNIIVGAGTGLYLGNSDGSVPFTQGVIEHNILLDTIGYNLQIKHQIERPLASGMPAAPGVTVIRHNLFAKSANSSRNELARPNLLLGHFPPHGPGSDDVYEVTGNLFFCNPTEALAQFEGNVTARGNVLINPAGDGMHIQPHHDVPKNIDVTQNFFATAGRTIGLVKPSPAHRQAIRDNTLIAPAQQVAGEQAAQPSLPPFAAALAHWLEAHEPARFAPLLAVADRMCSRAADTPPSRSVWRQHELRDHPVCTLMRLMRAPRTAARDAALLREIETASRKACSTP